MFDFVEILLYSQGIFVEVSRNGAAADFGKYSILLENFNIKWNESKSELILKKSGVRDFSGKSNHNYTISFSPEELVQVLDALAVAAITSQNSFENIWTVH